MFNTFQIIPTDVIEDAEMTGAAPLADPLAGVGTRSEKSREMLLAGPWCA